MNAVRETVCTRCQHRQVCKHTEKMMEATKRVAELSAEFRADGTPLNLVIHCSAKTATREGASL